MNTKLLLVVGELQKSNFLQNYKKEFYKGWDIKSVGSKTSTNVLKDMYTDEPLLSVVSQNKDLYKTLLIIKSSDFFIRDFDLDLVSEVVTFPILEINGHIIENSKKENSITLGEDLYYKILKTVIFENTDFRNRRFNHQFANYCFLQITKFEYVVDYVFPYVNSNDPVWYEDYLKYKNLEASSVENKNKEDKRYETNYSTGLQRFRDDGTLKYVFRSIEKNLPFIRKVHMIVSSDSQVPDWINRDEVDIILHEEFIPKNLLPTFSSSEIEMFLPNLPRVSEYFIYGNDDEIIMNRQRLQNWFFEGKPVTYTNIRGTNPIFTGDVFRRNDLLLTAPGGFPVNENVCLGQQHCPQPYVLSKMKECYEKYEKQILGSCTRFRENEKNYNQWIFLGYNYFNNFLYLKKRMCLTTDIGKYTDEIDLKKYTCICINDSDENLDPEKLKNFLNRMENIFSKKSKYEV